MELMEYRNNLDGLIRLADLDILHPLYQLLKERNTNTWTVELETIKKNLFERSLPVWRAHRELLITQVRSEGISGIFFSAVLNLGLDPSNGLRHLISIYLN